MTTGTLKVVFTASRTFIRRVRKRQWREAGGAAAGGTAGQETSCKGEQQTLRPSSMPGPRKDVALVRFALSKLDLNTYSMPSL